jgi:hypothetical protein
MLHTYKAILRGNQLEWSETPPASILPDQPIAVQVTILDETEQAQQGIQPGREMAVLLEQLAQVHALADIADPAAWEREIRQDRVLPDRDE